MVASVKLIYCLGLSHKSAPLGLREVLAAGSKTACSDFSRWAPSDMVAEFACLATCNRVELYFVSKRPLSSKDLQSFYFCWAEYAKNGDKVSFEQIWDASYKLNGLHAVKHLIRVCSSLDSVVVGETQINAQFKECFQVATAAKTLGPTLLRLCQEALAGSKKIRNATAIGKKTVSISHVAVDLAKRFFSDLSEHNFLFIGSGTMAKLAAHYARSYRPKSLSILNRTIERAKDLVLALGAGQAYSMEQLEEKLLSADVVVAASGAGQVVSYDMLGRVCAKRRGKVLFIADIAIPRNIDPRCRELSGVYLFEIDDLQTVVQGNRSQREQEALQAEEYVEAAALRYVEWLKTHSMRPVMSSLQIYLKDLMDRELARTFRKTDFRSMDESKRQCIEELLGSVRRKIVSDMALTIHGQEDNFQRQQVILALGEIGLQGQARLATVFHLDQRSLGNDLDSSHVSSTSKEI